MSARIAAIDLGSNSIKIAVAEVDPASRSPVIVGQRSLITRVGQGLDQNGFLLEEAMNRTTAGLAELVSFAQSLGAVEVACVGTAGLRGASNSAEFLERVERALGLKVEIIAGLREAELAFLGPSKAYGHGALVVVDVGGRSTELVVGQDGRIAEKASLEIGSVRLTERFLAHDPPTDAELDGLSQHLDRVLEGAPEAPAGAQLVGVAGTVLSLMGLQLGTGDMSEVLERGEGRALSLDSVRQSYEALRRVTAAERIRGTVLPAGRADVIVAGAQIVAKVMSRYGVREMIASNRGVRYGLLCELAERVAGS